MSDAAFQLSLADEETLTVHLQGKWQMETDVPSTKSIMDQMDQHHSVKRVVFDATELGSWDSNLLIFFFEVSKLFAQKNITVERKGLPAGVRQLIDLATAPSGATPYSWTRKAAP